MPDVSSGSSNGAAKYEIPDIPFYSPQNRKLKVLCIGGGVSGIMMAYNIQKQCENVDFVIYEKNHDIGGTWLENRYPGCACDIPSHAYTYNFALNPEWPKFFSYSNDIFAYLTRVVEVFDLRKYMTFNTEVVRCDWQAKEGQWKVLLKQTNSDGTTKEFEETCDLLLHAMGILNNYKWPEIKGIEKFKGRVIHTARWPQAPDEYEAEQWKGQNVGVIGSGASSIQTVPNMQPHVKHLDVFVRTGVWFVSLANNFGQNHVYSDEEREKFRKEPKALVEHAKSIEDQVNGLWSLFFKDSPEQKAGAEMFRNRMAEFIKDKRLLEGFTPKFGVGCRRVTPGDPYMLAIQQPNVDVHFTAVGEITEDGIIGEDGVERKVDTVVCATGFDVSYRPRFPVVGLNGVDLREKWKDCPESYLGLACPDFPNLLMFIGPTWPVENGSVMGPLSQVGDYTIQIIKKMQGEFIKSWVPKQKITDQFNHHVQEFLKQTVWVDDCRAWYKDNVSGRVNAVYSGSSLHYIQAIKTPRYEDFEIEYQNEINPWAYLGLGFTQQERNGEDASPYISEGHLDPKWVEALKIGQ